MEDRPSESNGLSYQDVQGKVEGTRVRGLSPMRWKDQMRAAMKSAPEGQLSERSGDALLMLKWPRPLEDQDVKE